MRKVEELKNTKLTKEIALVGHGISVIDKKRIEFDGDIMGVNNWQIENMTHFFFYDTVTTSAIESGKIVLPEGTIVIGSEVHGLSVSDYTFHPHHFPLKRQEKPSYRSGLRALWVALYMGYKKVYLYGYDYISMEEYKGNKLYDFSIQGIGPDRVKSMLDDQLEQYTWKDWPEDRIVQTNPESRLQFGVNNEESN